MDINQLEYGNPTQSDAHAMKLSNYLDKYVEEFRRTPMPKNGSLLTREELNMLREYLRVTEHDQVLKARYRKYDMSGLDYLRQVMVKSGAPEDDINRLIWGIVNDTQPLIAKLKMTYQRPRPFQLARYYKLTLYPYNSFRANSGSYPSGLTLQAALATMVLQNRYPQLAESLEAYRKDYALSRLYLGLHYPTDNDFAMQIASREMEDDEFKEKYGYYDEPRTVADPGSKAPDDAVGQVEAAAGSGEVSPLLRGTEPDVQHPGV